MEPDGARIGAWGDYTTDIQKQFLDYTKMRVFAFIHSDPVFKYDTKRSAAEVLFGRRWRRILTAIYNPYFASVSTLFAGVSVFLWFYTLFSPDSLSVRVMRICCALGITHFLVFFQLLQPRVVLFSLSCFENNFVILNLAMELISLGHIMNWDSRSTFCLFFIFLAHSNLILLDAFPFSYKRFEKGLSLFFERYKVFDCSQEENKDLKAQQRTKVPDPKIAHNNDPSKTDVKKDTCYRTADLHEIRKQLKTALSSAQAISRCMRLEWAVSSMRFIKITDHLNVFLVITCQIIVYVMIEGNMIDGMAIRNMSLVVTSWRNDLLCKACCVNIIFFTLKRLYRVIMTPLRVVTLSEKYSRVPLVSQWIPVIQFLRTDAIKSAKKVAYKVKEKDDISLEDMPSTNCFHKLHSGKESISPIDGFVHISNGKQNASCSSASPSHICSLDKLIYSGTDAKGVKIVAESEEKRGRDEEQKVDAQGQENNQRQHSIFDLRDDRSEEWKHGFPDQLMYISSDSSSRDLIVLCEENKGVYMDSKRMVGEWIFGQKYWGSTYSFLSRTRTVLTWAWFSFAILFSASLLADFDAFEIILPTIGTLGLLRIIELYLSFPLACLVRAVWTLESLFIMANSLAFCGFSISYLNSSTSRSIIGGICFTASFFVAVFIDAYPTSFKRIASTLEELLKKWETEGIKDTVENGVVCDIVSGMTEAAFGETQFGRYLKHYLDVKAVKCFNSESCFVRRNLNRIRSQRNLVSPTSAIVLGSGVIWLYFFLYLILSHQIVGRNIVVISTSIGSWTNEGILKTILINLIIVYTKRLCGFIFWPLSSATFEKHYLKLPMVKIWEKLHKHTEQMC